MPKLSRPSKLKKPHKALNEARNNLGSVLDASLVTSSNEAAFDNEATALKIPSLAQRISKKQSIPLTSDNILALQGTIGNRAVRRLIQERSEPLAEIARNSGQVGLAFSSVSVIQREFTYAKGSFSSESWQGKLYPWRNETAEKEWNDLKALYDKTLLGVINIEKDAEYNKSEQGRATALKTKIEGLAEEAVPYSKRETISQALQEFQGQATAISKDKIERVKAQQIATLEQEKQKLAQEKQKLAHEANRVKQLQQKQEKATKEAQVKQAKLDKQNQEQFDREQARVAQEKLWQPFEKVWADSQKDTMLETQQKIASEKFEWIAWKDEFSGWFESAYKKAKKQGSPTAAEAYITSTIKPDWQKVVENAHRKAAIVVAVRNARIAFKLNAAKAEEIQDDALPKPSMSLAKVQKLLADALDVQKQLDQATWQQQLGMSDYIIVKNLDKFNGIDIHVTFDKNSVNSNPPSIKKDAVSDYSVDEMTDSLLRVPWMFQIHSTLEADEVAEPGKPGFKNLHRYWTLDGDLTYNGLAKYSGDNIAALAKLKEVLEAYVTDKIKPRVKTAIDKAGNVR